MRKIDFKNIEKIVITGKRSPVNRIPIVGPLGDFKVDLKNGDLVNESLYFLTQENFEELKVAYSRLEEELDIR